MGGTLTLFSLLTRLGWWGSTLLGPEGTSVHCLWWVSLWWKLWLAVIITELLVTGALVGVGCGFAVGCDGGSVRTLRTAQWMRASLWPSY